MKTFLIILIATILFCIPIEIFATHGYGSGQGIVIVDGERFDVWGYVGDGPVPAFRLQDIAYMLNGTSAQFDIRPSNDARFDYWIVRGEAYVPTGGEFQPILEDRWVAFGSYGPFDWYGFDGEPERTVIVGIDGDDAPYTFAAFSVIQDVDYTYFVLWGLAELLGFELDWGWDDEIWSYYQVTTEGVTAREIPVHSLDFVDLVLRLSGHWVDEAFVYGEVIDERVVWPAEFMISSQVRFSDNHSNPIVPKLPEDWRWHTYWHDVAKSVLEDGAAELTMEGLPGRRVVVPNTEAAEISTVMYYIDDDAFTMMRLDPWAIWGMERQNVEATDCGAVRLTYLSIRRDTQHSDDEFRVYRSEIRGELGELIYQRMDVGLRDRLLFEFIDDTVVYGQVYFYTIGFMRDARFSNWLGWELQVEVDVYELLGLAPFVPHALVSYPLEIYEVEFVEEVAVVEYVETVHYDYVVAQRELFPRWIVWVVVLPAPVLVLLGVGFYFLGKKKGAEK